MEDLLKMMAWHQARMMYPLKHQKVSPTRVNLLVTIPGRQNIQYRNSGKPQTFPSYNTVKLISQKQVRTSVLLITAAYVIGMQLFYAIHLSVKDLPVYPDWVVAYFSCIEIMPYVLLSIKECQSNLEHDYRLFIAGSGILFIIIRITLELFDWLPAKEISLFSFIFLSLFFIALLVYTLYISKTKAIGVCRYEVLKLGTQTIKNDWLLSSAPSVQ